MTLSETAARYIGQKELTGNVFKDDTELGKKLHAAGQKDGDPWCALFCELVAKETYPERFAEWDKLFSASAVQTFKNFQGASFPIGNLPQPNAIVIWQKFVGGKAQWQGHAGIIDTVAATSWASIEGNTNVQGSREGVQVGRVDHRIIDFSKVNDGLRVLGFIQVAHV